MLENKNSYVKYVYFMINDSENIFLTNFFQLRTFNNSSLNYKMVRIFNLKCS